MTPAEPDLVSEGEAEADGLVIGVVLGRGLWLIVSVTDEDHDRRPDLDCEGETEPDRRAFAVTDVVGVCDVDPESEGDREIVADRAPVAERAPVVDWRSVSEFCAEPDRETDKEAVVDAPGEREPVFGLLLEGCKGDTESEAEPDMDLIKDCDDFRDGPIVPDRVLELDAVPECEGTADRVGLGEPDKERLVWGDAVSDGEAVE